MPGEGVSLEKDERLGPLLNAAPEEMGQKSLSLVERGLESEEVEPEDASDLVDGGGVSILESTELAFDVTPECLSSSKGKIYQALEMEI